MSRSLNFTEAELNAMLTYLESNVELVTKEFGGSIKSASDQRAAWQNLTEYVNAVGFGNRKTDSIKQKWSDLKCKIKKRQVRIRTMPIERVEAHSVLNRLQERRKEF